MRTSMRATSMSVDQELEIFQLISEHVEIWENMNGDTSMSVPATRLRAIRKRLDELGAGKATHPARSDAFERTLIRQLPGTKKIVKHGANLNGLEVPVKIAEPGEKDLNDLEIPARYFPDQWDKEVIEAEVKVVKSGTINYNTDAKVDVFIIPDVDGSGKFKAWKRPEFPSSKRQKISELPEPDYVGELGTRGKKLIQKA